MNKHAYSQVGRLPDAQHPPRNMLDFKWSASSLHTFFSLIWATHTAARAALQHIAMALSSNLESAAIWSRSREVANTCVRSTISPNSLSKTLLKHAQLISLTSPIDPLMIPHKCQTNHVFKNKIVAQKSLPFIFNASLVPPPNIYTLTPYLSTLGSSVSVLGLHKIWL